MRKWPINHDAFNRLTRECSYWIGFLMADGCVSKNGIVRVVLKNEDEYHLRRFLKFCGSRSKPLYRNGPTCKCAQIFSKNISNKLIENGVLIRKTWLQAVPTKLVSKRGSFWLGLLDGDGWISTHKANMKYEKSVPAIGWCGNHSLMKLACKVFSRFGGTPCLNKMGNIWVARLTGKAAVRALRWMYSSSPISLDRKRELFKKALQWVPNQRQLGPRFTIVCEFCHKTKVLWPSLYKRSVRKVCSSKCWYKLRSKLVISTKPSLPRAILTCKFCGNEFSVWGCIADRRSYCDQCPRKVRRKKLRKA